MEGPRRFHGNKLKGKKKTGEGSIRRLITFGEEGADNVNTSRTHSHMTGQVCVCTGVCLYSQVYGRSLMTTGFHVKALKHYRKSVSETKGKKTSVRTNRLLLSDIRDFNNQSECRNRNMFFRRHSGEIQG